MKRTIGVAVFGLGLWGVSCGGRSTGVDTAPAVGGAAGSAGAAPALGGAAGSAGAAPVVDVNDVVPSPGCGVATAQPTARFIRAATHVTGRTLDPNFSVMEHDREYFVWLPVGYNPAMPHRVTFQFMGCGSRDTADTNNYKLQSKDPASIYVAMNMAPAGFPPSGRDCFDNTAGKQSIEWEAFALVAEAVQKDFCIDENHVYVSGYSSGGWMANMLGCYFAGRDPRRLFGKDISVRGQAAVTGGPVPAEVPCGGKVAGLWMHDQDNNGTPISGNRAALARVLAVNGCADGVAGPQASWDDAPTPALQAACQKFTACPAEYPVIFCTTSGQNKSALTSLAEPGFIAFENLMNPP